jgi:hypothetical protein
MGPPWTPELTERALIADGGRTPHPLARSCCKAAVASDLTLHRASRFDLDYTAFLSCGRRISVHPSSSKLSSYS